MQSEEFEIYLWRMKIILATTAILGAVGVALGALGAHRLEGVLTVSQLETWHTAVKYQMLHVLVILILLLNSGSKMSLPANFFLVGIFLFSGSLYLLSAKDLLGLGNYTKILGPITPIGGLLLIIGWIILAIQFLKQ